MSKPQNKIVNHLWFDKEAKEAAEFYKSVFKNVGIENITTLTDTPSGDCDIVNLYIEDQSFTLLSAGPIFKINPAISFTIACESAEEVDELWAKLSPGGSVMMELGEYSFAKRYSWVADRFGVSWQIAYMEGVPIKQKITPSLMFTGSVAGKAEEAIHFYKSLFPASGVDMVSHYPEGMEANKPEHVNFASFHLVNQRFNAMDSAFDHGFSFNEAISFVVYCKDQEELDKYWNVLSAVPEAEQCGWLKDKYGLSWQIVPIQMEEMMTKGDEAARQRVTQAFLQMKKFDIAALEKAYKG